MRDFLANWGDAALTTLGFFWMAFWAFCLGYVISSLIQVLVTRERMQRTMGQAGPRAMGLATFFGFISSSCSFAALSSARALFQKGAGLAPALAFLLASTNLVVELGIIIFIFLSWHFVLGEYVGGLLLIAVMWLLVRFLVPSGLIEEAREHARQAGAEERSGEPPDWRRLVRRRAGWRRIARRYFMEWGMVWKDVTFGFTVAGIIAAFVPPEAFRTLFIGSGAEAGPAWWQIALHTLIGPLAAFFTFIGSMGNIPLAAILFGSGVSFAGVMAFIFSDLVVFPVLRISARYFGVRMAACILGIFLASLVVTALLLHLGFDLLGLLPEPSAAKTARTEPSERFAIDYTLFLNLGFAALSGLFAWLARSRGRNSGTEKSRNEDHEDAGHRDEDRDDGNSNGDGGSDGPDAMQKVLRVLAFASIAWLAVGVVLAFVV